MSVYETISNATKAVQAAVAGGCDINAAVMKAASGCNREVTQRIIEDVNVKNFLNLMKSGDDKTTEFPVADPAVILTKQAEVIANATVFAKTAELDNSFYATPGFEKRASPVVAPPVSKPYDTSCYLLGQYEIAKLRLEKQAEQRQSVLDGMTSLVQHLVATCDHRPDVFMKLASQALLQHGTPAAPLLAHIGQYCHLPAGVVKQAAAIDGWLDESTPGLAEFTSLVRGQAVLEKLAVTLQKQRRFLPNPAGGGPLLVGEEGPLQELPISAMRDLQLGQLAEQLPDARAFRTPLNLDDPGDAHRYSVFKQDIVKKLLNDKQRPALRLTHPQNQQLNQIIGGFAPAPTGYKIVDDLPPTPVPDPPAPEPTPVPEPAPAGPSIYSTVNDLGDRAALFAARKWSKGMGWLRHKTKDFAEGYQDSRAAGLNKLLERAKTESVAYNDYGKQFVEKFKQKEMLEDLLINDSQLRSSDPMAMANAYKMINNIAPSVAQNKEVVRGFLRMINSQSEPVISATDAKSLTELENSILENKKTKLETTQIDRDIRQPKTEKPALSMEDEIRDELKREQLKIDLKKQMDDERAGTAAPKRARGFGQAAAPFLSLFGNQH